MRILLFILLLCSPAYALTENPAVTNARIVADINTKITLIEENNRRLVGRIEELEFINKKQQDKLDELQKKINELNKEDLVKKANNPYQQFVTPAKPTKEEDASLPDAGEEPADNENITNNPDYNKAFLHLGKLDYETAQKEFKKFIDKNPDSALVGDAYYWLGEISLLNSDYNSAAINYLKSYKASKKGKKSPEAMLKLANSLAMLGKKQDSCNNYKRFAQEFPKAHQTLKEEAVSAQKELGCK